MKKFLFLSFLSFCFFSCGGDDDPVETPTAISISVEDIAINEGEDEGNLYIRLQLSLPAEKETTVIINSEDISATAGEDYTAINNAPVQFLAGQQLVEYQVKILGDLFPEGDETFRVNILSADGLTINKGSAEITILNDDSFGPVIPETGYSTPLSYPGMDLIWQDEFDGNAVDENFWTFEIGTGSWGWGNNESQYYRKENASIQDGHLIIEAKEESFAGSNYTSTRMITRDNFSFQYGRVDIRANLPFGQGIWPALWMLGDNITSIGWPKCGEIDIMELIGHKPDEVHGTVHWSANGQHAFYGKSTKLSSGIFNDEFHVFSIIWEENKIQWLLDDQVYHTQNITAADMSEFREKFFFIFNVAVGGNWPGYPDETTVFPQFMIVDYIRVFQ